MWWTKAYRLQRFQSIKLRSPRLTGKTGPSCWFPPDLDIGAGWYCRWVYICNSSIKKYVEYSSLDKMFLHSSFPVRVHFRGPDTSTAGAKKIAQISCGKQPSLVIYTNLFLFFIPAKTKAPFWWMGGEGWDGDILNQNSRRKKFQESSFIWQDTPISIY